MLSLKFLIKPLKFVRRYWKLNKRQLYAYEEKICIICNKIWNDHRKVDYRNSSFVVAFFLSGFSFTDTDDWQYSWGRAGTIFYSTLPLPPAHEHSDFYLQLCMWDDYRIFLIAPLVFTRLLLDEIYHLIELHFFL